MNLDSYPVHSSADLLTHSFVSEGPRGRILKYIKFQCWYKNRYNLAFGDWKNDTQLLDDTVRTNNKDTEKILATVARTVLLFMNDYPLARLEAKGSTSSRTRLYQMKIFRHLQEISSDFLIQGYKDGNWEDINMGENYVAFSITNKHKVYDTN